MQRFSSIVLVDPRGWVLLQERDEHPLIDPERWGFVGGHVDDGESYDAAAYRELAEETGLLLEAGLELFGRFPVRHEHRDSDDELSLYVMSVDLTDDDIVVGEGRQIVFVEPGHARTLDLSVAAGDVLPLFLDSEVYQRMAG
jgi:8-oxo-dGTP pyrophosphatase MutT (NUDIX family)